MAQPLVQKVRSYIQRQQLMQAGDRVSVAVSGGADSTALLRLLLELRAELGIVLSVVHLNHQLRGAESDADEQFVQTLSRDHVLEFHAERTDVKSYSEEKRLSLEAAGRELRYAFFRRLLEQKSVDRIATAHTMDDQAETVLLRLTRGAGTRGLAGIYPKVRMAQAEDTENWVVRPLLEISRKELEVYLSQIGQSWREDSSNQDERHARNRVRRGLVPWLEENLNPSIRETLSTAAEVARGEEEYWEQILRSLVSEMLGGQGDRNSASGIRPELSLDAKTLQNLPLALQRRILHSLSAQGIHLEFRHIEQVLEFAKNRAGHGTLSLPGWNVTKTVGRLLFQPQQMASISDHDFEYRLTVPGGIVVKETESEFHATIVSAAAAGYNSGDSEDLLDARLLAQELQVRNWREGDRFWPAHTKAPRKIKELLQERHVTGPARKRWPVIVSRDEIVWMRGFPSPSHLRSKTGTRSAVRIHEVSSASKP